MTAKSGRGGAECGEELIEAETDERYRECNLGRDELLA